MSIDWSSFFQQMRRTLSSSEEQRVVIISPYISTSIAKRLLSETEEEVTIVTNWSELNLLQGVSSLDLYEFCQERGFELRILSSLHAKLYLIGSKLWIGSANLTAKGMQLAMNSNDESMTLIENPSIESMASIDSLINESILVNEHVYAQFKSWLDDQEPYTPPSIKPLELIIDDTFSTRNLPQVFSPYELHEILSNQSDCSTDLVQDAFHDLALLRVDFTDDLQAFISNLNSRFFQLPLVKHLLEQLTHEWTRFGGMRTMIREACGGRDSVSRDDVTKVTQNLYEWVEDLDESGKYEYGVPRHSQLIRLKS